MILSLLFSVLLGGAVVTACFCLLARQPREVRVRTRRRDSR